MKFSKNLISIFILGLLLSLNNFAQVLDPCELPSQNEIAFTTYDASLDVLCFVGCATGFVAPSLDPSLYCGYWDLGDESTTTLGAVTDLQHCYNTPGIYQACLIVSCCYDTSSSVDYCQDVIVSCGEIQDCYVRSAFWNEVIGWGFAGGCVIQFEAAVFLGPNMINHQNSVWTLDSQIISTDDSATTLLYSGVYNVCHSVDGVNNYGEICSYSSCRDVNIICCDSTLGGDDNCSDITGDGVVAIDDLLQLLGSFGLDC